MIVKRFLRKWRPFLFSRCHGESIYLYLECHGRACATCPFPCRLDGIGIASTCDGACDIGRPCGSHGRKACAASETLWRPLGTGMIDFMNIIMILDHERNRIISFDGFPWMHGPTGGHDDVSIELVSVNKSLWYIKQQARHEDRNDVQGQTFDVSTHVCGVKHVWRSDALFADVTIVSLDWSIDGYRWYIYIYIYIEDTTIW
jgi:hypothetical protein